MGGKKSEIQISWAAHIIIESVKSIAKFYVLGFEGMLIMTIKLILSRS